MSTLSERYVWAGVRSVPEGQRAELEPELRGLVADSIDAQLEGGTAAADAERAALLELGAPEIVAARYTERTLQLIGPRLYLDWLRLLKLLLAIVVPIAAVAAGVARLLADAGTGDVGDVIGAVVATAIGVGVHIAFWVTLIFALVERYGLARDRSLTEWSPDTLPQLPGGARSRQSLGELIPTLAFLAVFIGWIIWQQFNSFFTDAAGEPIPLLDPALWAGWLPYFICVLALEMGFAVWLYLSGRWTLGLALANAALNVVFTVPALWLLAGGRLLNPAFLDAIPIDSDGAALIAQYAVPVVATFLAVIAVWDVVDGFVKAWRAGRRAAAGIRAE